jgi:hypothetical protein
MLELPCNYATIRFLPYRESGEFVNVGIVLHCPQTGFFDYKLVKGRCPRVTRFFPELRRDILPEALSALRAHLQHQRNEARLFRSSGPNDAAIAVAVFQQLLRRRESILHFAQAGTILSTDAAMTLEELYDHNVNRCFADARRYQEVEMTKRMGTLLRGWNLYGKFRKNHVVGDDRFRITLPFVHLENDLPLKAIKPLDLDRPQSTQVYDHGDAWIARFKRLAEFKSLPPRMIVPLRMPSHDQGDARAAADEVSESLQSGGVEVVSIDNQDQLHSLVAS